VTQLPGNEAIGNHDDEARAQPKTHTEGMKQPSLLSIAPIGHQKNQARGKARYERYHEQDDDELQHGRALMASFTAGFEALHLSGG
jgi:hypothetical protein